MGSPRLVDVPAPDPAVIPRKCSDDPAAAHRARRTAPGVVTSPGGRDVWSLVAQEPIGADDRSPLAGWLHRMCRVAARELEAWGVGLSIMSAEGGATVVASSGPSIEVVEQLQFTLGEGPCRDAFAFGGPVLVSDLPAAARSRWPGYGPAAEGHGVRAVFAFPLQVGAARLGALDVYRDQVGPLPDHSITRALEYAEAAMTSLVQAQDHVDPSDPDHPVFGEALDDRVELYHAQGMVKVQLGVSLAEAMIRLRAYAYAQDRPLHEVAADVVARRLTFEPES